MLFKSPARNRWVIAIAATVVMLMTGTLYSWGIFSEPLLVAFQWDLTTATWAYAIANFCLAAVGALIGGLWQDRVGPRRVAMMGVALWGCGNILAGLETATLGATWLYLSYGIVGGVGAGMAYITPVAMVTKWFPDKPGLAGGLVVSGFGLGAFGYNQVISHLEGFHLAVLHAHQAMQARSLPHGLGEIPSQFMSNADVAAVMQIFVVSGLVYLVVGILAASLFHNPSVGDIPLRRRAKRSDRADADYSPQEMLSTPQFYLLWLLLFANVIVGITIISNAVVLLTDITQQSATTIAPLFGFITLFNALGRFIWATISDRIGCERTFAAMFAVQAVAVFLLVDLHQLAGTLIAISAILLCCGGGFGTMPSLTARYFGTRHLGVNYGFVLSAWGVAGLTGPILLARLKDLTGSFSSMLPFIGAGLVLCLAFPLMTKRPAARALLSART